MISVLRDLVHRHLYERGLEDGLHRTTIEGIYLFKASQLETPLHGLYRPSLCIVSQGAKQVAFDDQIVDYSVGEALVVSVELPAVGQVTVATVDVPYLAIAIKFDLQTMQQVLEQMRTPPRASNTTGLGAFVQSVNAPVLDCIIRMIRLLDAPDGISILCPGLMRELCYQMLTDEHGNLVCKMVSNGNATHRIAKSIRVLRDRYRVPVRIDELASAAQMSTSTFHQHFKTITSMTPLQYQKKLRLLEARGRLGMTGTRVADVAYRVGYESASQFSREYARMFGEPPKRDAMIRRAAAA